MWVHLQKLLQQYDDNTLVIVIISATLGFFFAKFLPFICSLVGGLMSKLGKMIGGRFAYREFEKLYLDWVVTELRELKLTGIVSYDDVKKPQLEQVFVSLRIGWRMDWDSEPFSKFMFLNIFPQRFSKSLRESTVPIGGRNLSSLLEDVRIEIKDLALKDIKMDKNFKSLIDFEALATDLELKKILREHQRIALLGVPGAGKTTLLQYLALAYARERAGDPKLRCRGILKERLDTKEWHLPLFLPLGSIASMLTNTTANGRDTSIVDLLPRILPPDFQKDYESIASNYFTYQLEKGNCVVLLDGLDEVSTDTEFQVVVRAIESFALRYKQNQFVITSRIAGWRSGVDADFKRFYINDLTDDQVDSFIDSWYSAVERNAIVGKLEDEGESERRTRERRAAQKANDLKNALRENTSIRLLATNPMLLSIIALVHRSLATLPKERSKLYAECAKILLEQWDISRGLHVDDTNLKLEQKEAIMRRIAFAFHTGEIGESGGGREAKRGDVQRIIADMLPSFGRSSDDAQRLLQRLIERSGIITEQRRDVLTFAHHTFQEHFTAQYLPIGERIEHRDYLLNPERLLSSWWREVILLYAGLLSDSSEFIHLLNNPSADDLCQQRLRLASLCLGDAVEVKKIEVRQSIAANLLKIRTRGEITKVSQAIQPEVVDYLIRWSKGQQWYSHAAIASVKGARDDAQVAIIQKRLTEALGGQESDIHSAALKSLSHLPEHAVSSTLISKTVASVSDSDSDVRLSAVMALGEIGRINTSEEMVLSLISALRDDNYSVRTASVDAIEALGDKILVTSQVLSRLESMLSDKDREVQLLAVSVFPIFRDKASPKQVGIFREAVEKLILKFENEDSFFTLDYALKKLAEKGMFAEIVEKVERLLDTPDSTIRAGAIRIIENLGVDAINDCVYKKLLESLYAKESNVRSAAASALIIMKNVLQDTDVKKLIDLTQDKSTDVRVAALRTLGVLGENILIEQIVDAVSRALYDKEEVVQIVAAEAIANLGYSAAREEIVDKLIKALENKHRLYDPSTDKHNYHVAVISAIGVLGETIASDRIIKELIRIIKSSKDFSVRKSALDTLIRLESKIASKRVFEEIFQILKSTPHMGAISELTKLFIALDAKMPDFAKEQIAMALEGGGKNIRLAALRATEVLMRTVVDKSILVAITKRLGDDECEVRDKAWEVLEEYNRSHNIWT